MLVKTISVRDSLKQNKYHFWKDAIKFGVTVTIHSSFYTHGPNLGTNNRPTQILWRHAPAPCPVAPAVMTRWNKHAVVKIPWIFRCCYTGGIWCRQELRRSPLQWPLRMSQRWSRVSGCWRVTSFLLHSRDSRPHTKNYDVSTRSEC